MQAYLRRHEAWQNLELYHVALDELIARDKQQWMTLHAPLQELFGFGVNNDEIIMLMLSFRLKALGEYIFIYERLCLCLCHDRDVLKK